MSVVVMAAVYKSRLGCVYRKAVALKLADCADDDGSSAYPAVATICDHAEIGERTVQRKLRELEQISVIRVDTRGGGAGRTTRYAFCLPTLYGLAARSIEVFETADGPRTRAKGAAPAPLKNGAAGAENGAGDDKKGCRSGTRPILNPSLTHPQRASAKGAGSGKPVDQHGRTSGRSSDQAVEEMLERIALVPSREAAIDKLLRPVALRKHFDAPAVEHTLAAVADWIAGQGLTDVEMAAAADLLLDGRRVKFTEAAVRDAVAKVLASRAPASEAGAARPSTVQAPRRAAIVLRRDTDRTHWTAWHQYIMATLGADAVAAVDAVGAITVTARFPSADAQLLAPSISTGSSRGEARA